MGTLVERVGARTLPAYIDCAFEAMPRWAKVPRLHPITVRFGAAQPAEVLRGGSDDGAAEHITAALRERVAGLAGRAECGSSNDRGDRSNGKPRLRMGDQRQRSDRKSTRLNSSH